MRCTKEDRAWRATTIALDTCRTRGGKRKTKKVYTTARTPLERVKWKSHVCVWSKIRVMYNYRVQPPSDGERRRENVTNLINDSDFARSSCKQCVVTSRKQSHLRGDSRDGRNLTESVSTTAFASAVENSYRDNNNSLAKHLMKRNNVITINCLIPTSHVSLVHNWFH